MTPVSVSDLAGAIAPGALVYQEGFVGYAITGAATGEGLQIECDGVHRTKVAAGVVKGDKLYANLSGGERGPTVSLAADANDLHVLIWN